MYIYVFGSDEFGEDVSAILPLLRRGRVFESMVGLSACPFKMIAEMIAGHVKPAWIICQIVSTGHGEELKLDASHTKLPQVYPDARYIYCTDASTEADLDAISAQLYTAHGHWNVNVISSGVSDWAARIYGQIMRVHASAVVTSYLDAMLQPRALDQRGRDPRDGTTLLRQFMASAQYYMPHLDNVTRARVEDAYDVIKDEIGGYRIEEKQ